MTTQRKAKRDLAGEIASSLNTCTPADPKPPAAQPTPGPWMVSLGAVNCPPSEFNVYDTAGNYLPDREAARRLIAAAPAMLAALEQFVAVYEFMGVHDEEMDAASDAALAALKLARGK